MPRMTVSHSAKSMAPRTISRSGLCTTICLYRATITVTTVRRFMNLEDEILTHVDHGVWRRAGDVVAAIHTLGMHCEDTDSQEPIFLREARRRICAAVYRTDKSLADFFGRPAMMCQRYSDRPLPLDLDDEAVTSDDIAVVDDAISKLDASGWAVNGRISPASWVRLQTLLSRVKERFLEASLTARKDVFVIEEIE